MRNLTSRSIHVAVCTALFAATLCLLPCEAEAQQQPPAARPKDDVVVMTRDQWELHLSYYPSNGGKESPVVVLLAEDGKGRQVWGTGNPRDFFGRLHEEGYAVVSVDLRKQGQSKKGPGANLSEEITPRDRAAMVVQDLEAVKGFIFEEHQAGKLNMNKMAIIAAGESAAVALNYAMYDWAKPPYDDHQDPRFRTPRGQDVRALILLSPIEEVSGLNTGKALAAVGSVEAPLLGGIAAFLCAGSGDRGDVKSMYRILTKRSDSRKRMAERAYAVNYSGTDLIGRNNPRTNCEDHMLVFLKKFLGELTQRPWEDRRSRYER